MDKLRIIGNCLHPVKVYNKYTHDYIFTPCGKCAACNNSSANKLTLRVYNEILQHRYSLFFTLTYDNEHLPRFELFSDKYGRIQTRPVGRCKDSFDSCPLNHTDLQGVYCFEDDVFLPAISNDVPSLQYGVCCKKDIQDFFKRLRKKINKLNIPQNEKDIRYFVASEYGPETLRPHYHGFIFFDSEKLSVEIESLVVDSWGLYVPVAGKVNAYKFDAFANPFLTRSYLKFCDANTAYYVADYVSGNLNLPELLRQRQAKPFHLCSKNPIIGCFEQSKAEIFENLYVGTYAPSRAVYDRKTDSVKYVDIPLSSDSCSSLFRKCFEYSITPAGTKRAIYTFYSKHFEEWRLAVSSDLVRYRYDIQDYTADYSAYFKDNPQMMYRSWCSEKYKDIYFSLHLDKDSSWYASRQCYMVCRDNYSILRKYFPYGNAADSYLWFLDRYFYLKEQYQLKCFYQQEDDLIQSVGYQSAMIHCYPLMWEHVEDSYRKSPVLIDELYFSLINNPLKKFSYEEMVFYSDVFAFDRFSSRGVLDFERLNRYCFERTSYYRSYVEQENDCFKRRIKSKKVNNTSVYGFRKID